MASDDRDTWDPLSAPDVDVERDEDRLLDGVVGRGPRRFVGRVRVLPEHAFFFEHAVDHLPGLYLLEAGRQLAHVAVSRALHLPPARVTSPRGFVVRFEALAEKDAPILATADLAPGPTSDTLEVTLSALQAGRTLVRASSLWTVGEVPPPARRRTRADPEPEAGGSGTRPVAREAVHKRLDENVLVEWTSGPEGDDALEAAPGVVFQAGMRRLADHPYFGPRRSGGFGGLYLVEACRQLAEAVAHGHLGVPLAHVFLQDGMDVSLPAPANLDEPVRLEVTPLKLERRGRALRRMQLRFVARQAGRVVLEAEAGGRVVPPSVYRRVRGAA